jgi:hypothetical protein
MSVVGTSATLKFCRGDVRLRVPLDVSRRCSLHRRCSPRRDEHLRGDEYLEHAVAVAAPMQRDTRARKHDDHVGRLIVPLLRRLKVLNSSEDAAHAKSMSTFEVDEHLHAPTPRVVISLVRQYAFRRDRLDKRPRTSSSLFTECSVVLVSFRLCTRVTVNTKCLRMLRLPI